MKSYFLEALADEIAARAALAKMLPGQEQPSVLLSPVGDDAIAYFNVEEGGTDLTLEPDGLRGPFVIIADMSGRHYHEDVAVLDVLSRLQTTLGGTLRSDNDEVMR